MLVSIAAAGFTSKPNPDNMNMGAYLDSFYVEDMEPATLVEHICQGDSFTNVFDGRPKRANFVCGQVIAVDVDKGGLCSMEALLQHPFVRAYAMLVYPTLSHTEAAPRHRVVFVLDEPIRGADGFEYAAATVYDLFPDADRQCSNAGRTFLGNGRINQELLPTWAGGNTLKLDDLRLLARQRRARQLDQGQQRQQRQQQQRNGGDPAGVVAWAVAAANPGERNHIGYWLACRLVEDGVDYGQAKEMMLAYQRAVGRKGSSEYTEHEALMSLHSAYGRKGS